MHGNREKLPPVLSAGGGRAIPGGGSGPVNRVALTTAYAADYGVGEVVRLKIAEIDSQRMLLHIEQRQGWQGPLCDAIAAASEDPAHLLEAGAAQACGCFRARNPSGIDVAALFIPPAAPPARRPASLASA